MEIVELEEKEGYMYVNTTHRVVAYFLYCPDTDVQLWVLTPESEALALEDKWREEDEKEQEGESNP